MATSDTYVYIEWNKKFEIGIQTIDEQHKKLIQIINTLYSALMTEPTDNNKIRISLQESTDYVKTHFAFEEKLMRAVNYPDFIPHKRQHDEYIMKIIDAAKGLKNGDIKAGFAFVKFLCDWLLYHIAYTDTLYVKDVLNYYKNTQQKT
ncbi:MAG: bacteriohemerythrin [Spirochaetales bacterium]